jgi:hypothetical protein
LYALTGFALGLLAGGAVAVFWVSKEPQVILWMALGAGATLGVLGALLGNRLFEGLSEFVRESIWWW